MSYGVMINGGGIYVCETLEAARELAGAIREEGGVPTTLVEFSPGRWRIA